MANEFIERIERFIHTHYDHVRRDELPDGTSVIVFDEYGCFDKMSNPCELFTASGFHVIKDYTDEFCNKEVFFIVDESEDPLNSVQLVLEEKYWAMYSEQVKMAKVFDEVYAEQA